MSRLSTLREVLNVLVASKPMPKDIIHALTDWLTGHKRGYIKAFVQENLTEFINLISSHNRLFDFYPMLSIPAHLLEFESLVEIMFTPSIYPPNVADPDKIVFAIDALLRCGFAPKPRPKEEKDNGELLKSLREAFTREYIGQTHLVLLEVIARTMEYHMATKPSYGPTIHIVQSSGTGKSRSIQEVIKLVPGLTICFRPPGAESKNGFPLGDDPVTTFFYKKPRDSVLSPDAVAAGFLGSLFTCLVDFARESNDTGFWMQLLVGDDKAQRRRETFFQGTVQLACHNLEEYQPEIAKISSTRTETADRARDLCRLFCKEPVTELARHLDAIRLADLPSNLDKVSKRLVDHFIRSPTFFLALDEATFLNKAHVNSMSLRRIMLSLSEINSAVSATGEADLNQSSARTAPSVAPLRVWTLMIDTHSGINDLLYPVTRSTRLASQPFLPPFSHLPFDLFVDSTIPSSPRGFMAIERLCKYGRPLWSHGVATADAVLLAKAKLLCDTLFRPVDLNQVLAVLSQRIWIDLLYEQRFRMIEPPNQDMDNATTSAQSARYLGYDQDATEAYQQLAVEGIASHMRVFRYLTKENLVVSTNPSEPILSLAARSCLLEQDDKYGRALDTFHNRLILKHGVIDRGNLGEFLCRLLLTMSMDFAVAAQGKGSLASTTHAPIVPVKDFLKQLLGEDLGMGNAAKDVLSRVEGTYLSFTHFAPVTTTLPEINTSFLQDAWARTMAWQCHPQQAGVDGILPIYCGDPDGAVDTSKFSYIAFQSKLAKEATQVKHVIRYAKRSQQEKVPKRRRTGEEEKEAQIESVGCNVWGPPVVNSCTQRRPLVLHMDLGTSSPLGGSTQLVSPFKPKPEPNQNEDWLKLVDPQDKDFSALHIRGHCVERYPVLKNLGASRSNFLAGLISDKRDGIDEWLPCQTEIDATYSFPPPSWPKRP